MKRVLFLITLATTVHVFSQQQIDVFKNYTSVLIFESDIVNIINGNELNYIVEKDVNRFSNNKTLIISQVPESLTEEGTNVVVFTRDGNIYHFDLVYGKPKQLIHHIDPSKAHSSLPVDQDNTLPPLPVKANKKAEKEGTTVTVAPIIPVNDKMSKVIEVCKNTSNRKKRIFQNLAKSYNVLLSLKDIAYSDDELYMYFDLRNKGGQAYDVEYMHFFKSTSESDSNITSQKDRLPIYYIHQEPKRIKGKSRHSFIAVIEKTSINENKEITVRIKEKGGERDLNLNINDQIINNPVKL